MKAHKLIYDQATFGITGKSLRMLRNAIADNLHDKILVLEIPTGDILCGFLVLNKEKGTATWSGDGFRTDRGGEGGRGYAAAHKLLDVFGLKYLCMFPNDVVKSLGEAIAIRTSDVQLDRELLKACNKIAEGFSDEEFKCVYETTPWY